MIAFKSTFKTILREHENSITSRTFKKECRQGSQLTNLLLIEVFTENVIMLQQNYLEKNHTTSSKFSNVKVLIRRFTNLIKSSCLNRKIKL